LTTVIRSVESSDTAGIIWASATCSDLCKHLQVAKLGNMRVFLLRVIRAALAIGNIVTVNAVVNIAQGSAWRY
jgi:hypothetical protein